jgi:hypothetical protein
MDRHKKLNEEVIVNQLHILEALKDYVDSVSKLEVYEALCKLENKIKTETQEWKCGLYYSPETEELLEIIGTTIEGLVVIDKLGKSIYERSEELELFMQSLIYIGTVYDHRYVVQSLVYDEEEV